MNLGAIAGGLFGGPVGAAIGGALFEGLTKPNASSFDLPAQSLRSGGAGQACGCGDAGGNESPIELATSLLEMAQQAEDPKQKADLIKAAIELLGGETGADAADGKGGSAGASGGKGASGGCEPSKPEPAPEAPACPGGSDAAKTFSGEGLRQWLSAEGGTVEQGKGGFSVENGANGTDVVSGEIDRGQSLTFTVPPEQAKNGGGEVTLANLYRNGPDGNHVEQAKVTFYDEDGRVVDEQIVQGTPDGKATASTDKPFARAEVQPLDDGAGNSSDNSDFTLASVSTKPASGGDGASGGSASEGPDQELLDLLGKMPGMIMETVEDPEQQSKLLDLVAGLTRSLAGNGGLAQAA